jgi:hypothetical protein
LKIKIKTTISILMVDRNTTLQNKDDIEDSNSTSTVKFIILDLLEFMQQLIIAFKYTIIGH